MEINLATSPTQLSIKKLKEEGYLVAITEKWNHFCKIRQDMWGFCDILAIRENEVLAVQTTSASNMSARANKIADSENVGMVHIIQRMKPSVYYGWLERIGLGDISGVDLPSETPSTLKPQEQFNEYVIEPATAAFGQGFSLTPIQMVQLQGILASGGKLLTPHVVKGLINEEGEEYYQTKLPTPRQIVSPATAQRVIEMMTNVVEKGTGLTARIPGWRKLRVLS